ncbi:uncharacterized protein LOC106672862 [Cimex lectularius]|uniref:Uncharacterized protein n=1 Tax=Cimex lectularius TaxID=79782 RepID=A0A8I6SFR0_CIMLE|nr:uncharacterized protein LOC106672862 [Cimex lectularius]
MQSQMSSLVAHYRMISGSCSETNCSGHGECLNGTCFCEIQFVGEECRLTNTSYFVIFATVFFIVALVCLVQLIMSIIAEWNRLKTPSVLRACRITTQKLLYFVVFLAAVIRGAYFTSPKAFEEGWYRGLMSAYYPLLLSGSSLIVCFWAEIFHLRDLKWEHRQFLSKSFLAFVTFNVISYSLLLAEFVVAHFLQNSEELKGFYSLVFNGCYAALLFIVVIFFLIYGVEVFFKVRGGYLIDEAEHTTTSEELTTLFKNNTGTSLINKKDEVNLSQLNQSRLGLLSQALMLTAVMMFLFSETLGHFWKNKVPISSRNILDLIFRTAEIGVALWFPCVLWNSMKPEQLWILNPKRILKSQVAHVQPKADTQFVEKSMPEETVEGKECWICYDNTKTDSGPLIQPCFCKGDVQAVHYECLKKWLIESKQSFCLVCRCQYGLSNESKVKLGSFLAYQAWKQTLLTLALVVASVCVATVVVRLVTNTVGKVAAVGSALLILYICIKFLCEKQLDTYYKARVSALQIHSHNLVTISETLDDDRTI